MNELFTLLIVLAAIISFLNKIFGKKKPQQTRTPSQLPGQKPRQWIPPWLEPEDLGIPDMDQAEVETKEVILEPRDEPFSGKLKSESSTPIIDQRTIAKPAKEFERYEPRISRLQFDLSSSDALKRGIVLAEILGTCKGRKNMVPARKP
ncbi:MAG TPA: hypothetical protein VGD14_06850 [bacterium]